MELEKRITAFAKLGAFLNDVVKDYYQKSDDDPFVQGFKHQIKLAEEHNPWFTEEQILYTLNNWSKQLTSSNIKAWLEKYNFNNTNTKNIGIVMAGNIPLVGFHDFISVLLSGHSVLVKQSSDDKQLLPYLSQYLIKVETGFKDRIEFTEAKLENFDAVIATGSDNTSRYFEYYFRNIPSIVRKNRNSVAVLQGKETDDQLANLADDIFRYYGLGCRNVSKIFVPNGYDFAAFFNAMYSWKDIIHKHKYANNYDYNKAVYLMSEFKFLDNGFLMLKKDEHYSSPIATVFYEEYQDLNTLREQLNKDDKKIQCIVSDGFLEDEIDFGATQTPSLSDYADNMDTIEFLSEL